MTREEILNMSAGREMDALIAEKVMKHWVKRDVLMWQEGRERKEEYSEGFTTLAHYSTDIADAWEVVEKIGEWRGFEFVVRRNYFNKKQWQAGWFEYVEDGYESRISAESEFPALAICRAALLAVFA